jgi:hypothetical protein
MSVIPTLNLPKLKRKGIMAHFGGLRVPFYTPTEVMLEGQPVKLDPAGGSKILKGTAGATAGAEIMGFSLQETYIQSDARHKGHHYPNDTRQEILPGCKIGVLTGHGYMQTINYKGAVTEGGDVYFDPADGTLVGTGAAAIAQNKLPAKFRSAGTNNDGSGPYVLVEFNFPLV